MLPAVRIHVKWLIVVLWSYILSLLLLLPFGPSLIGKRFECDGAACCRWGGWVRSAGSGASRASSSHLPPTAVQLWSQRLKLHTTTNHLSTELHEADPDGTDEDFQDALIENRGVQNALYILPLRKLWPEGNKEQRTRSSYNWENSVWMGPSADTPLTFSWCSDSNPFPTCIRRFSSSTNIWTSSRCDRSWQCHESFD